MKEIFLNKSFNFISSHKELDHYNEVKIKYGLEVMYHFFTKIIGILLISCILNIYKENLLVFCFYGPLRIFCHGLHAKSNIACWISSIATYIFIGFYAKYVTVNEASFVISTLLMLLTIILWCPSDTPKRPIKDKNKRQQLKIISLVILLVEFSVGFIFKNLRIYIFVSVLLQCFLVNPIAYKLTKTPRSNYKLLCV